MSWESIIFNLGRKADSAGATANSTMFSWVKDLHKKVGDIDTAVSSGSSAIKSIQRGVVALDGSISLATLENYSVPISTVKPEKCFAFALPGLTYSPSWDYSVPVAQRYTGGACPYVVGIQSNSITLRLQFDYYPSTGKYYAIRTIWNIVEFN